MAPEFEDFRGLQRDGGSRDEILAAMKDRGRTVIQAIKASMQLFGVGLGAAKAIVASHPSWCQTARASEPLHDALLKAFRDAESPRE